jgi:uncharacterized protein YciI
MKHFLLVYDLADTYLARRGEFRSAHLKLGWDAAERGELLLGGPLPDPYDLALLLFTDKTAAENFAKADPYVANGLIKSWRVREWTTAIGEMAANPVRP